LLNEKTEIDSIMNIVIKSSKLKDVCFSLTTINSPMGHVFSVLRLGIRKTNVYFQALQPRDIQNVGYFTIKGYTVFVSADEESTPFFKKTSVKKIFRVITLKDTVYWYRSDSSYRDDPEHHYGKFYFGSSDVRDKVMPRKQK
jgi:hypothetical protein